MRIIGGRLGGRRLSAPAGAATRPTSDRVREALFNILGPPPPGARVLDAFAGAGGLGFEALSRGAEEIWLIDSSRGAIRCLHENAQRLEVQDRTHIHCADAVALVRRWSQSGAPGGCFGWVFLDPPYRTDLAARMLEVLGTGGSGSAGALLEPGAVVVAEHDRRNQPAKTYGCLVRTDLRRYGDTELSFFRAHGQAHGHADQPSPADSDQQDDEPHG